jgi:D-aminoacyl-tRNA deacylase
MRAVIQRVRQAAVYVSDHPGAGSPPAPGEIAGRIGLGFVVLLGVHVNDVPDDAATLAGRVAALRVFDDEAGRLNRSLLDIGGEVLSVPQFTLYADTRRGRRPSFVEAAPPERAEPLYRRFNARLAEAGVRVVPGRFRTHMVVEIHNDGPVTIVLDSSSRSWPA